MTVVMKAVVFDLDGTLASFNLDYRAVRTEVRRYLVEKDIPAKILLPEQNIFEMLRRAETFSANSMKSQETFEETRREALTLVEQYELEAARRTHLLPSVVQSLKALRRAELKIGLFTINSEKSVRYILNRFKIGEFFDAVVPRDSVKHVKPNKEHLEVTLKTLKVSPSETVVVGDGVSDMWCAKELGIIAVGSLTGFYSERELIDSGADYLVTSILDIPRLVSKLGTH